ncbi:MBL fold metallo-hydrolase [Kineosporia sp. A_224]|uniref:MBL fold metallo-hydrolase n=1 Tax=Kineosporia sp. A_224 TaxID=1962180 RepID=UPI000B4B8C9D|nr:MBL fold metallo-hydrolase [Kineosporia sp. A_224]
MGGTGGCAAPPAGGPALTWLGHSSVLVEVGGARVLADPVLRQRVGALRRAVPATATAGAVRTLVDDPVDVVLLSHLHHDHCDLPTLRRLRPRLLVVPPGARSWLGRNGFDAVELAPGCELEVADGVHVTAVPAEHLGRREPWGPTASSVGHLVESAAASVWLAGDTGLFAGMAGLAGLGRRGVVDLAAVPVWGWGPNLGPGHLDPDRAAEAVEAVGARVAVPVHWGTYHPAGLSFTMRHQLRTPGDRFAAAVAARGAPVRAEVLAVGATTRLPAGGSSR